MTNPPPYIGSEDNFTKAVANYLDHLQVLYTHVANEGFQRKRIGKGGKSYSPEGVKQKLMGKKAGVPDILIFEPRGKYIGMAIELKVNGNPCSPAQKHWLAELDARGWHAFSCNSLDWVLKSIDDYLAGKS